MNWLDLKRSYNGDNNEYIFYEPNYIGYSSLFNLGNSCYLNAVIQGIIHTRPFMEFILRGRYSMNDMFFNKLVKLLKKMWSDNHKETPSDFHKAFLMEFKIKPHEQQDAHEVMLLILNKLHDLLKYEVKFKDFRRDLPMVQESINELRGTSMSIVNHLFLGQYNQRTQCLSCHKLVSKFPVFMGLILNLREEGGCIRGGATEGLVEVINNFCVRERLTDYMCDSCHKRGQAFKKTTIWRPPHILMITLARFSDPSNKNRTKVIYPLKNLDISRFINYPQILGRKSIDYNYNLYSVICHIGDNDSGHYYNYSKANNFWIRFDDHYADKVKYNEEVVDEDAYILFYERDV